MLVAKHLSSELNHQLNQFHSWKVEGLQRQLSQPQLNQIVMIVGPPPSQSTHGYSCAFQAQIKCLVLGIRCGHLYFKNPETAGHGYSVSRGTFKSFRYLEPFNDLSLFLKKYSNQQTRIFQLDILQSHESDMLQTYHTKISPSNPKSTWTTVRGLSNLCCFFDSLIEVQSDPPFGLGLRMLRNLQESSTITIWR